MLSGLALRLTGSKLADCVEQLELPALLDVVYRLRHLVCRRLDKEFEAKAVDIALTCGDSSGKSAAPISGQERICGQRLTADLSLHALLHVASPSAMSSNGSDNPSEAMITLPFGRRTTRNACTIRYSISYASHSGR